VPVAAAIVKVGRLVVIEGPDHAGFLRIVRVVVV